MTMTDKYKVITSTFKDNRGVWKKVETLTYSISLMEIKELINLRTTAHAITYFFSLKNIDGSFQRISWITEIARTKEKHSYLVLPVKED